jgi:hypothetical protein
MRFIQADAYIFNSFILLEDYYLSYKYDKIYFPLLMETHLLLIFHYQIQF